MQSWHKCGSTHTSRKTDGEISWCTEWEIEWQTRTDSTNTQTDRRPHVRSTDRCTVRYSEYSKRCQVCILGAVWLNDAHSPLPFQLVILRIIGPSIRIMLARWHPYPTIQYLNFIPYISLLASSHQLFFNSLSWPVWLQCEGRQKWGSEGKGRLQCMTSVQDDYN